MQSALDSQTGYTLSGVRIHGRIGDEDKRAIHIQRNVMDVWGEE